MAKTIVTREDRAANLLATGAVTLNLDGTATVKGSGKAIYTVTKESCSCPDFQRRNLDCKHRIATRSLCGLYRACRDQARETGRVRVPYLLSLALPKGGATTPATCSDCGTAISGGRTCVPCLDQQLFGKAA